MAPSYGAFCARNDVSCLDVAGKIRHGKVTVADSWFASGISRGFLPPRLRRGKLRRNDRGSSG